MNEIIKKQHKFHAIKWIVVGFLLCIMSIIIITYIAIWYYDNKILPADIDSGIDITNTKVYLDYRAQTIAKAKSELASAKNEYERWLAMRDLSVFLIDEGKIDEANAYAKELLELAPKYRDSWDYGNVIHRAHIALGRIALRRNNINEAKEQLLEAGRTPGSPQLDSFGPNMLLAKELLEKGERDVVLEYIKLCSKFWTSGKAEIKIWQDIIRRGRIPDFQSKLL
jgi:tetratricopeptide (TPR) repeat protein